MNDGTHTHTHTHIHIGPTHANPHGTKHNETQDNIYCCLGFAVFNSVQTETKTT